MNIRLFVAFLSIPLALFGISLEEIAYLERGYVEKVRNQLHENPELRWEEEETIETLKSHIDEIQVASGKEIKVHEHFTGGLVADLIVKGAKKQILFRADIDALPICEEASHSPCSKKIGIMHAGGHDVQSAMLMAGLKVLASSDIKPKYNVRFVWQRAIENPGTGSIPESGAKRLIEEGILSGIDEVFALHLLVNTPSGLFVSREGPIFSNSARIEFQIKTTGGHVSSPHQGVNALRVTHAIQNVLNDLVIRHKGPKETISIEPSILLSGTATNSMPSEATMWYSFRNLLPTHERDELFEQICHEVNLESQRLGAEVKCRLVAGHPSTFNHSDSYSRVNQLLLENQIETGATDPILSGEDFSYFLQKRPGSFWILGAFKNSSGGHHSPNFDPDPSVFWKGVLFWLVLASG